MTNKQFLAGVAGMAMLSGAPVRAETVVIDTAMAAAAADADKSTAASRRQARRLKRIERVRQAQLASAKAAEAKAAQADAKAAVKLARDERRGIARPATQTDNGDLVVTGTRILANRGKTGAPVQSLGKEELRRRGLAHLEDALNQLPQTAPMLGALRTDEQGGRAGVDLRGLGAGRTLVLINGQRATNNTNTIPGAMIERIDVLTGGASAVYGSDAIGGVVNYIVKRNFTGISITGEGTIVQHTNRLDDVRAMVQASNQPMPPKNMIGGARGYLNATTGWNFDGGKGNISINGGINRTSGLRTTAYETASCRIATKASYTAPPGSPNDGTQIACDRLASFNPYGVFGVRGERPTFLTGDDVEPFAPLEDVVRGDYSNAIDGSRRFRSSTTTDEIPIPSDNYVYRADQRHYYGANLHYQFDADTQYNGSYSYNKFQNRSEVRPIQGLSGDVQMNCDNPFLSAQQAKTICGSKAGDPDTFSLVNIYYYPQERIEYFRFNSRQSFITNQISGKLTKDIRFEVNANRRVYEEDAEQDAYINEDYNGRAFINALRARRVNGQIVCLPPQNPLSTNPKLAAVQKEIDARCKPIDIFSAGGVDQALINAVVINPGSQQSRTNEVVANGTVSGTLGAWGIRSPWAKEAIGFSVTAEHRVNGFEQDSTGFNSTYILPFKATAYTTEFASELSLPILQDVPLVRYFQINGALREGLYKTGKTTSAATWRIGANWVPVNGISFRGSYSRSLRAPIFEAFNPQQVIRRPLFDPCSAQRSTSRIKRLSFEQCAAAGVTRQQYDALSPRPINGCEDDGACIANIITGGNPDLKPEESTSVTVGATFAPSFIRNFDLSVDLYKIKVTGFFFGQDPYSAFNQCLKGQTFYCSNYHRDPVTGRLDSPGAFADGRVANGGFSDNRGVDIISNYRIDLLELTDRNLGAIGFAFNGNWRLKNNFQRAPQVVPYDCTGYFGPYCGSRPAWRHTLRTVWAAPWQKLSIYTLWRYTAPQQWSGLSDNITLKAQANPFDTGTRPASLRRYPTANYFDLGFNVDVAKGSDIRLNVTNIFDRRPHVVPDGWLGTDPGVYDALGRQITLGFNAHF